MSCPLRLLPLLVALPLCHSFASAPYSPMSSRTALPSPARQQHHHVLHATQREESLDLERSTLPQQHSQTSTTRRDIFFGATASLIAVVSSMVPTIANAEDTIVTPPKVKSLVTLDISIARGPSRPLRIELFQNAPPASLQFFSSLVDGTMQAPCEMGDSPNIEICEDYQSINVGYKNSQLWRLVPNKRMDFGRVDSMFTSRIVPSFVEETITNVGIQPSTRGAVTIKRGGGAFEFTVTPSYNPALDSDKEDLVVVGRIAEEDLPFMDEINAIPVRKDIVKMGDVPPLGAKFARACDFTAPDSTCAQFKPLKKIIITETSNVVTSL